MRLSMILLFVIPMVTLAYFFFAVVHFYYWKNYFHTHKLCKQSSYGGCSNTCAEAATFSSIVWPVFPFGFFAIKYAYRLPRAVHRAGKSVGTKLTEIGK